MRPGRLLGRSPGQPCQAPRRDQGFALLIVLWSLVLVSLLFIGLASSTRSGVQLTSNLRAAAELEAVADGAIHTEIFALMKPGGAAGPPAADGDPGTEVSVQVTGLSGMLNPNTAPPELMRALLLRVGADPREAGQVAAAIADWRTVGRTPRPGGAKRAQYEAAGLAYGPPGTPFETLDELRLVLGMTSSLLASVRPYLTLFGDGPPDAGAAAPAVRSALRDVGFATQAGRAPHDVVRITAVARRSGGAQAARRAVIRIGPSGNGRDWRVLAWDSWSALD